MAGAVATHYLCTEARQEVNRLLGGQSLARAGNWPDWIRSQPKWRHTRRWHYINVGDEEPIDVAYRQNTSGRSGGDVLWAIDEFQRQLADASRAPEQRARALRFLAHFVVDVHQPLHVGRAEDRGGNEIAVLVAGRWTNLHAVWDAQSLLRAAHPTGADDEARRLPELLALTADRVSILQSGGPLEWAAESQALRPQVYGFGTPAPAAGVELDAAYLDAALETVELRLSEAGVRLAGRINAVFCRPARSPQAIDKLRPRP